MKQHGLEKVNAIGYQGRAPIHYENDYDKDAYSVNDKIEAGEGGLDQCSMI